LPVAEDSDESGADGADVIAMSDFRQESRWVSGMLGA
jgi:hypothetical protein